MSTSLFEHVILPVASVSDAKATSAAVRPYLRESGGKATVVHVVEKAGGALDKASVEQREQQAERIFDEVTEQFDNADIPFETEILYNTNVATAISDFTKEQDASAIVFTPRGGSRWLKLFTGNVATALFDESDRPVIVLPDADDGETDA